MDPQQLTFEQRYMLAKVDMETQQKLYDSMVTHCFKKCVSKLDYEIDADNYKWGELSIKEMSCTDRCVQKYIQSKELAQKRIEKVETAKQKQMELQQTINNRAAQLSSWFGGGSK